MFLNLDTPPDKHPTSRLFRSSLRWRIRCTDDFLDGLGGDAKGTALQYRYIQVNDGERQACLVFDIDRGGAQRLPAAYAWEEAGLPPPSWTTINRENGHAHLGWLLETPVFDWYGRHPKPARYAEMIRRAMTAMMDADRGYVGMLTKNPYHEDWETVWGPPTRWSLDELMEYIPAAALERPRTKHKLLRDPGIGRNVGTFDYLRFLAYGQVARYKRAGKSLGSFSAYLRRRADEHNLLYPVSLPESEIKATAKSVANWTWDRFSPHWLSRLQRRRGRLSGRRRRERTAARDQDIVAARSTGKSYRKIGSEFGISHTTAMRICRRQQGQQGGARTVSDQATLQIGRWTAGTHGPRYIHIRSGKHVDALARDGAGNRSWMSLEQSGVGRSRNPAGSRYACGSRGVQRGRDSPRRRSRSPP